MDLWEKDVPREEMLRIAGRVITSGHLSVVEHCSMTFGVTGVSRTLLAQYTRHRIGISISVQSQRHVWNGGEDLFSHVAPSAIAENRDAARVYYRQLAAAQEAYEQLLGMGIKKEDARFVLPGGAATNFVTTLNLRSLLYIYNERVVKPGAQWEVKEMVKEFARLVCEREPWLMKYFEGLEVV